MLMAVCSFWIFFQESFLEKGLYISMNGRFIFSGGFIFRRRGQPIGVVSVLREGRGVGPLRLQKNSCSRRHLNHASPH